MSPFPQAGRRVRRALVIALAAPGLAAWALLGLCLTDYPWRLYRWLGSDARVLEEAPRHIIILGGGGIPSESGLMRTYRGAEEGRLFTNALFIVALPVEGALETSATARMKAELVLRGIAPERIRIEPEGRNTREQALNIRGLLEADGPNVPVLVVTSPDHLKRALLSFRKAGFRQASGAAEYGDSLESALAYDEDELGGQSACPCHSTVNPACATNSGTSSVTSFAQPGNWSRWVTTGRGAGSDRGSPGLGLQPSSWRASVLQDEPSGRIPTSRLIQASFFFAMSTMEAKPSGSWMAISDSILRFSRIPALVTPWMNRL